MTNKEVIARLKQKNWYVKCQNKQDAGLVLQACDDAGIKWLSGEKATAWDFDGSYPLYIDFCNAISGITGNLTGSYTGNCTDITDWFFNAIKNNDDNGKLTPQNAEQEHWVQIILARIRGIPIESFSTLDGTWVDDRNNSLIFMNCEYRIKPEPASTPLPISRELWSYIDKKWQYAAMGDCGSIFFFERKPTKGGSGWDSYFNVSDCPLNINTDGINWEASLTERPEDV